MMVYDPLWETMQRKNVSTYALINTYGVSRGLLDKLKHNRTVTTATLERLCKILDCEVQDVIAYKKDEQ